MGLSPVDCLCERADASDEFFNLRFDLFNDLLLFLGDDVERLELTFDVHPERRPGFGF